LADAVQRERWAVSALFLTNGALFASVLPRLPEIKADLDLTDGQLGLALLGVGLGGLAASISTRWLLPRLGSRRLAVGATLLLAAIVPLVGVAPTRAVLFAVLVAVGATDALTDVAMNVSGVEAQRRLGRAVLNSMHAVWSIGAVTGGLVGSAAAGLRVPLPLHLAAVAGACAVLALVVRRHVPDASGAGTGDPVNRRRSGIRLSPALALLCGLAVLAALVEDAPASWSAVYLTDHAGAAPGAAGLGFTAFMAAMVAGRLVGDRLVDRFGVVVLVRTGGLAAGVALGVALLVGGTVPAIVAFAVVGFGAAPVFPAMITAAGALPGQGVAAMNVATRLGFLASPPVVGRVADGVGLPLALGLLVVPAALGLAVLAGAARAHGR
jgi:predicted MFS family arabinose efflux permease